MDLSSVYSSAKRASRDERLIEGVVANMAMFRQAAPRDRAEIAAQSRLLNVRRGAPVCRLGDPIPGLLVVAYGLFKLSLRRADGEERVVRFVGAGETFGEAPALIDRPSPFDASALADSMLVVIPRRPVLRLLERHPAFAQDLVSCLADGYLALLAELQASVQSRGVQRLASFLDAHAEADKVPGGWLVRLPTSKTAVAARLGVKKETLSRMLRDLSERGCIAVLGREIRILDRARLAELAA